MRRWKNVIMVASRICCFIGVTALTVITMLGISIAMEIVEDGQKTIPDIKVNYYDGEKHMIGGIPYWVEKTEGGWLCHYGDKTAKWEPRPWQQEDYKKEGPAYYNKWMQGGIMYPFELTMDEREKLVETPNEFKARCIAIRSYAYCYDWHGEFGNHILDSRGGLRNKIVLEWGRNYRRNQHLLPEKDKGKYRYQFFIVFRYPEDSKGLGEYAMVKSDINDPDNVYLYLPSQRKVRRLSVGSKKDSFAGTPHKNEDIFNYHYLHPIKFVRHDIFACPDAFGFRNEDEIAIDPTSPHLDGIGGPCWVLEETPAWPNWWFEKKTIWIDKRTINTVYEEAFDARGRKIRTTTYNVSAPDPKRPTYTLWANWPAHDILNNIKYASYLAHDPAKDCFYDTGFTEDVFTEKNLTREISSMFYFDERR